MPNIVLLLFDLLVLPISVIRLIIIYYFGSKYNLEGFKFLDVINHSDKPYFNKDDQNIVSTLKEDYRMTIRDDTRLYPVDVLNFVKNNISLIQDKQDKQERLENTENSEDYQEIENDENRDIINSIKNELENFFI
jgi:hypothetical protein